MEYILDNRVNIHTTTGNYVMGWFGHWQQAAPSWFIMNREGKVLHSGRRNYIVPLYNRRYNHTTELYVKHQIKLGIAQALKEMEMGA